MQEQPLFSVLVANYNNGKHIAECLDSILKQDYPNIEIIIVDDGSTDNSLVIIEPYQQKHRYIKFFKNEENKGVGFTKKRCIDEAEGEILGFVDPDDTITSDAVSKMIEMHQKHPQASLLYSNYYECNEDLKIINEYKSIQVKNGENYFFNDEGHIGHFCSFKKSCYKKTSGINPYLKNAEDQDLYFKLYDVGEAILLDEPLYYYRIHNGGLSTLANTEHSYFWRWKVILARAEEKGIDIEPYFWETFVRKEKIKHWLAINTFVRNTWLFKIIRNAIK